MITSSHFGEPIALLKKLIEFKCGCRIVAYHDCKQLANALKKEKIVLSPNTLARLFQIIGGTRRPYLSTLDLLAQYVGYGSFSNFIYDHNNNRQNWLIGSYLEHSSFSISALELAIQRADWDSVKCLLDACSPRKDDYDFPMFLGNAVRTHPHRNEFLNALMEVEVGRLYFFERFVDEDDPDGYFSHSLSHFYSNYRRDEGSMIFKTCFQLAKQIYNDEPFEMTDLQKMAHLQLNPKELHFHQLSRCYEMKILFAARSLQPFAPIQTVIDELLDVIQPFRNDAKCWIVARPLKALAHVGWLTKALEIPEWRKTILDLHVSMGNRIGSIGELIIQLVSHAYCNEEKILNAPRRIYKGHLNETNIRISIESATAMLYATDPIKGITMKNLKPFAKRTGNSWVLNLLENS